MNTKDIFISYKAEEIEEAEWVRRTLEQNGISCWMAPDCIAGGSSYAKEIPKAIRECKAFVLLLSRKSQGSRWVPRELDQAINAGKTVMPFMLEDCALRDDFNFYLTNVQRYEAYANKSAAMEKMIQEIRALMKTDAEPAGNVPKTGTGSDDDVRKKDVQEEQASAVKKKWSPALIGGIAAAVVLIVCLAVFAGQKAVPADSPADAEQALAQAAGGELPEETEETKAGASWKEDSMHITLTPSDEMSVKGFHAAADILEGRLEIFSGGEYEMDVKEESIDLVLPKQAFGSQDFNKVMQCYLSRAAKLYGFCRNEDNAVQEKFVIDRDELQEVTLETGTIEGVEPAEYEIGTEEYQYVKVVLTDACASRHAEEIREWGGAFAFGQDMDTGNSWWYYNTFPEGDGKTFYILNNDTDGNFAELTAYNLTHDPLEDSFYYAQDMNELAAWEDPAEAQIRGEHQSAPEEITGRSVTFSLTGYGELSAGEWLDAEMALKERLDALDQPYAFAKDANAEDPTVYIKTGATHMGRPVMEILGTNATAYMYAGLTGSFGLEELDIEAKEDGTWQIRTSIYSYSPEDLESRTASLRGADAEEMFLKVNSIRWLAGSGDQELTNGKVVFDRLPMLGGQAITEENLWIAELIGRIQNGVDMPCSFRLGQLMANADEDGKITDETDFAVSYLPEVEKVKSIVKGLVPEASVYNNGASLYVSLNLDVDDSLPENGTAYAEEIYEKTDFEHSIFESLMVYLVLEDNDVKERARIYFDKLYAFSEEEEGYISAGGAFANGRIEEYKDKFKNIIETDPFYIEHRNRSEWGGFSYEF